MNEQHDITPEEPESETTGVERIRTFIQENLRVITSVFIVAAIAIGIYSYSDRSVPTDESGPAGAVTSSETEKIAEEEAGSEGMIEEETMTEEETVMEADDVETVVETGPSETSRETEGTFVETAERGDGLTNLARRATTHYLDQNADSSLTAEHRVYIEDYLRKHVDHEGGIDIGTSVEFSKDLIREAIDASKRLDRHQLDNLKQYSARVAEFR